MRTVSSNMARCMRPEVGEDEVFVVIPGGYDVLSDDDIEVVSVLKDCVYNQLLKHHFLLTVFEQ